MKPNPDDRRDNVFQIQRNMDMTVHNMELADEIIAQTDDPKVKADLIAKNQRREEALKGMRAEIRDEVMNRE